MKSVENSVTFESQVQQSVSAQIEDEKFQALTRDWFISSVDHRYSYNFRWAGLPIIQYPQDIIVTQELIFDYDPDIVIETGIARGGSISFYSSLLRMLEIQAGQPLGTRAVCGVDIQINQEALKSLEQSKICQNLHVFEGSSISDKVFNSVAKLAKNYERPLIVLDSHHEHDHVLRELNLYSSLVPVGGHILVYDTVIEHLPDHCCQERPWGKGNNPSTAIDLFLEQENGLNFERDDFFLRKSAGVTVAPNGWLRRVN